MLPEIAWSLKLGELIIGTTISGEKLEGVVEKVIREGIPKATYLAQNHSEMSASKYQHDGPTVVMAFPNSHIIIFWRPDDVERVTDDYTIKCYVCDQYITLRLALRTINKMAKGEPLPYCLELETPSVAEQISKSLCKYHV